MIARLFFLLPALALATSPRRPAVRHLEPELPAAAAHATFGRTFSLGRAPAR